MAEMCRQRKIFEGHRYHSVPEKFAKGARFSPILGALSLYDLKTHDAMKPIEASNLFEKLRI